MSKNKFKDMAYTDIDFDRKKFKKYSGEIIEDIISYIINFVNSGVDVRVIVGCDSIQKKTYTQYALTIMLYDEMRHNGAHVIYMKIKTKKERDLFSRLMNESLYSLDLSNWLDEKLEGKYIMPKFSVNDYDGSVPTKKVEIHVDVNPEIGRNSRNKSFVAYSSIMGLLCGLGFSVKSKPVSFAASSAADSILK